MLLLVWGYQGVRRYKLTSTGSRMRTDTQLNMSWTVAPANERRKTSRSLYWPMATIVFVTEVPILAPMIMGMACMTVRPKYWKKQPCGWQKTSVKIVCSSWPLSKPYSNRNRNRPPFPLSTLLILYAIKMSGNRQQISNRVCHFDELNATKCFFFNFGVFALSVLH